MHYWLVESESEPSVDPLVLWVQGGPGCSSLLGYFTEVGPFTLQQNKSSGPINLVQNEYAWNKIANVLYWESPIGVGYSYTTKKDDYSTNDTRTAEDSLMFLQNFFKLYPEYRNRNFYIAGESYAGIYIPMLAYAVMKYNEHAALADRIPLKGLMVGNGCTGNKVGSCGDAYDLTIALPFFYAHGLYSSITHDRLMTACSGQTVPTTTECAKAVNDSYLEMGLTNVYDIYGDCLSSAVSGQDILMTREGSRTPRRRSSNSLPIRGLPECAIGPLAQIYMRQEETAEAIHVSLDDAPSPWSACSDWEHQFYGETVDTVLPFYPDILRTYRTLIYNGDADGRIPYTDNEAWTSGLGLTVVRPWHQWLVDDQVITVLLFAVLTKNQNCKAANF